MAFNSADSTDSGTLTPTQRWAYRLVWTLPLLLILSVLATAYGVTRYNFLHDASSTTLQSTAFSFAALLLVPALLGWHVLGAWQAGNLPQARRRALLPALLGVGLVGAGLLVSVPGTLGGLPERLAQQGLPLLVPGGLMLLSFAPTVLSLRRVG